MGALKHTPTRPARDMPAPPTHHQQGTGPHGAQPRDHYARAQTVPVRRAERSALAALDAGGGWRSAPTLDLDAITSALIHDGALTAAWGCDARGHLHRMWSPRALPLAAWWPLARLDPATSGRPWTEALPCPPWPDGALPPQGDPDTLWQLAAHTPGLLHDAQARGATPQRALWHQGRWWWCCALKR